MRAVIVLLATLVAGDERPAKKRMPGAVPRESAKWAPRVEETATHAEVCHKSLDTSRSVSAARTCVLASRISPTSRRVWFPKKYERRLKSGWKISAPWAPESRSVVQKYARRDVLHHPVDALREPGPGEGAARLYPPVPLGLGQLIQSKLLRGVGRARRSVGWGGVR